MGKALSAGARREREAHFAAVWARALAAGKAAGQAAVPTPMIVSEADGLSGSPKPGGQSWYVSEGVCGFAWVTVKPGTSPFARWLKARGDASKGWAGGVYYWVSDFGQSMVRKEAAAAAIAEVLRDELGVRAYAGSRMD
jgi:hypothetical protein